MSIALVLLLILTSCKKEEKGLGTPTNLTASDGTAVGSIHIEFTKDDGVSAFVLERREKGTDQWTIATYPDVTSFDDSQEQGLPPGVVFEYRVRNGFPEGTEYSEIAEGYAYDIIQVKDLEITRSSTSNSLSWTDVNISTFSNESTLKYAICRSDDSLGVYTKIGEADVSMSYSDEFVFHADLQSEKHYYQVNAYYEFWASRSNGLTDYWGITEPIEGVIVGSP